MDEERSGHGCGMAVLQSFGGQTRRVERGSKEEARAWALILEIPIHILKKRLFDQIHGKCYSVS